MVSLNCRILAAAAAGLLISGAGPARGAVPQVVEAQKLVASDGIGSDKFGFAVAADGDTLAIGAPNHYSGGTGPGSVYIFARNAGEWEEGQRFFAPGQAIGEEFGHALSLSGDLLMVGAPFTTDEEDSFRGAAYVFARDGQGLWELETTLVAEGLEGNSLFGDSIALQGTTAVISGGGDVHVFQRDDQGGWSRTARLSSIRAGVVALDGGTIVAAGIQNDGTPAGVAYVRDGQGQWVVQSLFAFPEPPEFDFVTRVSVALERNIAAIGTVSLLGEVNRAHLFVRDGSGHWALARLLTGDDDQQSFGASVALHAPAILVGALHDGPGSVTVFQGRRSAVITPRLELVPSDFPFSFGAAVTLDRRAPIVGAWADSQIAPYAGSVYVFRSFGP